jgi:hypothetical protein
MKRAINCLIVGGIIFSILSFIIGCDKDKPVADLDWHGVKIYNSDLTLKSGETFIVKFRWRLDYIATCDARFTLYSNIPLSAITYKDYLVTSPNASVEKDIEGKGSVEWNGCYYNFRKSPVPPGVYYMSIEMCNISSYSSYSSIRVIPNDYDSDGDNISDAVENENTPATTQITYGSDTYYYGNDINFYNPPIIPKLPLSDWEMNVGTHDYTLASDIPKLPYPPPANEKGTLINGLRIANSGTGYQYERGGDAADTDNWGALELINLIEKVARKWNTSYPSYPVITSMDMSKEGGGYFHPHDSHQKGLDMDMRYIRSDNSSGGVTTDNISLYSRTRTQELINLLFQLGNIVLIYSDDTQLQGITYDADHNNHFHVRIADPDGNN